MQLRPLAIPGAIEITPVRFGDDRGEFFEWYRFDRLEEALGHSLDLRQANASRSKKGVVRGIHFADLPLGQAKYVSVMQGAILDYVVDIRVGSPTFGEWESVLLDSTDHRSLYIAEGLGHAFVALDDDTLVSYLVSDVYRPTSEHGINPLDETVGLRFPLPTAELLLSDKDRHAPSLIDARDQGLLPTWAQASATYTALDTARK